MNMIISFLDFDEILGIDINIYVSNFGVCININFSVNNAI